MYDLKMAELQEIHSPDEQSKFELTCDLCRLDGEHVNACVFCTVCLDSLCEKCLDYHSSNGGFSSHNIIDKDKLPENVEVRTLQKLKEIVFCSSHDVQFDHICQDHAKLICQFCIRKGHRHCKQVVKIDTNDESDSNAIQEFRDRLRKLKKKERDLTTLISNEKHRQAQMRHSILSTIENFLVKDEKNESGYETGVNKYDTNEDIDVKGMYEELLRILSMLNCEENTKVVAKHIQLTCPEYTPSSELEKIIEMKTKVVNTSKRLEMLNDITTDVINLENEPIVIQKSVNTIHMLGDTCVSYDCVDGVTASRSYRDAEMQTADTTKARREICVGNSSVSTHASDSTASCFYRDVEIQTVDIKTDRREVGVGDSSVRLQVTDSADVATELCPAQHVSHTPRVSRHVTVQTDTWSDNTIEPFELRSAISTPSLHTEGKVNNPATIDRETQTCSTDIDIKQSRTPLLRRSLEFVGTFNVMLEQETESSICDIVVLKSHQIAAIDETNNCMKVFDKYFTFQMSCRLDFIPCAMCTVDTRHGELVAVSLYSKRIQTYKVYANRIEYMRGLNLSLYPRGICSVSRNTIAVLMSDREVADGSRKSIQVNNIDHRIEVQYRDVTNGRIVRSFNFDKNVMTPHFMIKDSKNNFILSEKHQMSAVDSDGYRLWYCKSSEGAIIDRPMGMTIDPEGNIYACGQQSNNIHQVSSFNYRHNRLIIPSLPAPQCITYDPYLQRLIVGCLNCKSVYVYTFV